MVAGNKWTDGFPLGLGESPSVDRVSRTDVLVYGASVRFHPITKLPLEDGSRALPDHEQALRHLKIIEARDGRDAALAIYAKLTNAKPRLVGE
jgi:hypothetical protein